MIEELISRGHRVSILTTKRRGWPDKDVRSEVTIYRAGYNTLLDRLYDVLNRKARRNETGTSGTSSGGILSGLIQRLVDKTWRKTYWPDGSKLFLKPGLKVGRDIIRDEKIDRIISVGLPFTAHLIGQGLKAIKPNMHWHMDIQDPFCYSKEFWVNNFDKYADKNINAERSAFEHCDSASVTNPVAKEKYVELFPEQTHKLTLVPPLFAMPKIDEANKDSYYDMQLYAGRTHLTYAGSFYTGVRSIEPFLKFLSYMLDKEPHLIDLFQFHFLGQLDAGTMKLINEYPKVRRWYVLHGFKNRTQTMAALHQTDLVMNFGNSTDYHLPSKVVDYLYLNKPLVNFISTEKDSTKAFFSDKSLSVLNLNLSDSNFETAMASFKSFAHKPKAKPGDESIAGVVDYTPQKLVEAYLSS